MTISTIKPNSLGGVPCFSAYQNSAQSVSAGTWTKVQLQAELFDTNNCFDSTTNYRFQPTVAGYYQLSGFLQFSAAGSGWALGSIYKNGSPTTYGPNAPGTTNGMGASVNDIIYMNGSTDYVEFYIYNQAGSTQSASATSQQTNFKGTFVRGV